MATCQVEGEVTALTATKARLEAELEEAEQEIEGLRSTLERTQADLGAAHGKFQAQAANLGQAVAQRDALERAVEDRCGETPFCFCFVCFGGTDFAIPQHPFTCSLTPSLTCYITHPPILFSEALATRLTETNATLETDVAAASDALGRANKTIAGMREEMEAMTASHEAAMRAESKRRALLTANAAQEASAQEAVHARLRNVLEDVSELATKLDDANRLAASAAGAIGSDGDASANNNHNNNSEWWRARQRTQKRRRRSLSLSRLGSLSRSAAGGGTADESVEAGAAPTSAALAAMVADLEDEVETNLGYADATLTLLEGLDRDVEGATVAAADRQALSRELDELAVALEDALQRAAAAEAGRMDAEQARDVARRDAEAARRAADDALAGDKAEAGKSAETLEWFVGELEAVRAEREASKQRIEALVSDLAKAESERDFASEQVASLRDDARATGAALAAERERGVLAASRVATAEAALEALRGEAGAATTRAETAEAALEAARGELAAAQLRAQSLSAEVDEQVGLVEALTREFSDVVSLSDVTALHGAKLSRSEAAAAAIRSLRNARREDAAAQSALATQV